MWHGPRKRVGAGPVSTGQSVAARVPRKDGLGGGTLCSRAGGINEGAVRKRKKGTYLLLKPAEGLVQ